MTDEPNKPDSPDAGEPAATPTQNAPPADETPDERKARLIAEAKTRVAATKAAATTKGAATTPAPAGAPKAPVKKKEEGPKPTDASAHPLVKKLRAKFSDEIVEATEFLGQLSVRIAPPRIVSGCEPLRHDAASPFDLLCDVTCVHWPDRAETAFEVVY